MATTWSYRAGVQRNDSLIDFDVHAIDGDIGKIVEESLEVDASHLVVDTGFWIFGNKRVVPAQAVRQINHEDQTVFIDLTKDEVKGAPDHHDDWSGPVDREPFTSYYTPFQW